MTDTEKNRRRRMVMILVAFVTFWIGVIYGVALINYTTGTNCEALKEKGER
jgi:hypothetical protein